MLHLGNEIAAYRNIIAETELVIYSIPRKRLAFFLQRKYLEMTVFHLIFGNHCHRFQKCAQHCLLCCTGSCHVSTYTVHGAIEIIQAVMNAVKSSCTYDFREQFHGIVIHDGDMVGEIKSVNTFQYKRMTKHPSAWKQCQWYMHLTGLKKGFVLCEDKNNQEFKLEVYDYDPDAVAPFIDRAEEVIYRYNRVVNDHKMVGRPTDATSPSCKRCNDCAMKDACWNIGMGRVRIK